MEERERASQGTCIENPWAWTMGWGLPVVGAGQGRATAKNVGQLLLNNNF